MRRFLLAAIRAYQRYISPYKGFSCAYREHTGHASCSTFGFRAVRKFGVFRGLIMQRERTSLCGVAQRRIRPFANVLLQASAAYVTSVATFPTFQTATCQAENPSRECLISLVAATAGVATGLSENERAITRRSSMYTFHPRRVVVSSRNILRLNFCIFLLAKGVMWTTY